MKKAAGYRLHIEATETEPELFDTMRDLRSEQYKIAKASGRTFAEIEKMSYIMTETEYKESLVF